MSPEQARGKPVDKRADVWSFGVLLWEMLTGRSLFAGETVTDVIAAVVTREPDLDALPKTTPPTVRRLLSRCLRKDPRTRLPDIGAARLELQEVIAGHGRGGRGHRGRYRARSLGRSAGVHARALGLGRRRARARPGSRARSAFVHLREVQEPEPAARFTVDAPEGWSFETEFGWPVPSP